MQETKKKTFLPYGCQRVDDVDIEAVVAVLKSDYLTTGPVVSTFEEALAKRVSADYAVCVNSGTAALHVVMIALDIRAGDHVIVPAITFLATANAARLCGADVIFADVDPDNGLMGPQQLNEALQHAKGKNIKAVAPVHLAGQTENLTEIQKIANKHNLYIIEDACHAIGTIYDDGSVRYPTGACRQSDATIFSFHPVKTITMGEGGAVTMRKESLYQCILELRCHGMNRNRETFLHVDRATSTNGLANQWYYEMAQIGLNYRSSDIHCALGLSQLNKLNVFIEKRRELVNYYDELFRPLSHWVRPIKKTPYCIPGWHLYVVLIDFKKLGIERACVMQQLRRQNIGTQVHYIPVNEQPYYQNFYGNNVLPGARHYYEQTLTLPLYPAMNQEDVEHVVNTLKTVLEAA